MDLDKGQPPNAPMRVREAPADVRNLVVTGPAEPLARWLRESGCWQQPWYWAAALQGQGTARMIVAVRDVEAALAFMQPLCLQLGVAARAES